MLISQNVIYCSILNSRNTIYNFTTFVVLQPQNSKFPKRKIASKSQKSSYTKSSKKKS